MSLVWTGLKIGSAEGPTDVCSLWLDHYRTLLNSVPYYRTQMEKLVNSVASTNSDVSAALDAMVDNKAVECYGLRTEHYKLAGDLYYSTIALCNNAMLTHGLTSLVRGLRACLTF